MQALPHSTPEQQGISSSAIFAFIEAIEQQIHDLHSFMLLRHGHIIAEGWWSPYERESPHMLFSLSKSFTSTAVGLAIHEGYFSLDDAVISFFPDDVPAQISENLAAMQVRHLLAMATGHDEDTTPYVFGRQDGKWETGFFSVPVPHQPGTHFVYNTGATYMLSAIVQKTTGQKLIDYLRPRIFEPLGIKHPTWQESPRGVNVGGTGLSIRTEDIARFGQLYLQKGKWMNQQLIPQEWVATATSLHTPNGDDPASDWAQGYGYQFWRCKHGAYRGDGAFGQYCVIMPEQDAVLAITGGLGDMQEPLNLVWEHLLAAMQPAALPADPAAHSALQEKLSTLHIDPVQGMATSAIHGGNWQRTFRVDPNPLQITTVMIEMSSTDCIVTMHAPDGEERMHCGIGRWQDGTAVLFSSRMMMNAMPVAISGAWVADDRFSAQIRLRETPFVYTMHLNFGVPLTIDLRVNVSFEPIETVTLTCHAQ